MLLMLSDVYLKSYINCTFSFNVARLRQTYIGLYFLLF